jgi:hypothetical protein
MKKLLHITIGIFITLAGCGKNSMYDAGPTTARWFDVQPYTELDIQGVFDIELIQDTSHFVVVTFGENMMKGIGVESSNNILTLKNDQPFNLTRNYDHCRLEIHFVNLTRILIQHCIRVNTPDTLHLQNLVINDHGEVTDFTMKINCNSLTLGFHNYDNTCGIYTFSGKAIYVNAMLRGSVHYKGSALETQTTTLIQYGIGDCYINATYELNGEINNNCKVYIYGKPNDSLIMNNKQARKNYL